jgi:hypothetical protein
MFFGGLGCWLNCLVESNPLLHVDLIVLASVLTMIDLGIFLICLYNFFSIMYDEEWIYVSQNENGEKMNEA